jgi:predicted ATPase
LEHPFSLGLAHVFASAVAHACRQPDRVQVHAKAAVSISRDQDFRLLLAWSSAFEGWAAVTAGNREDGLCRIANAIAEARAMGSEQFLPHLAGLAADANLMGGNASDGLKSVEDGLRVARRTGERFWHPELLRLKGELQIAQDPRSTDEAEQAFREAIDDARSEGAMLLALRAAVSLGRLLRCSGRGNEAGSLIAEMSHGLDQWTGPDISEANTVLRELSTH